ncbi:hypothetical protein COP2_039919 [Malus domestica]|nr:uncharacterized protein LOC114825378 [Malus domestica]
MPSGSKCLADLCGALHCDAVMNTKSSKTKCNPASVARNHHLCEGLANSCFPINQSPSARRLNEFFLHQFCHAHTCSGKRKLFPRGGKVRSQSLIAVDFAIKNELCHSFNLLAYFPLQFCKDCL